MRPNFFSRAMRHNWVLALVVLIFGAMVATGVVVTSTPSYSSTSIVFLEPLAGNPYSPTTPTSRTEQLAALTTEAGLIYTDAVMQSAVAIAKADGFTLGVDARNDIFTEVPSNSTVVQITLTQSSPEIAQAGAQALAEAYLGYRKDRATNVITAQDELRKQRQASITKLLTDASDRLNAAKTSDAEAAQIVDLQQQVTLYAGQLATVNLDQTGADATSIAPGDIISPAALPTAKNGLNPLFLGLAIFLGGAALGIVLALAKENVDQKVRDAEDFAGTGISPVRGVIRQWKHHGEAIPDIEGYRRLANVLGAAEINKHKVLLLAATPNGADTLSVANGVAQAFQETGTAVVVVDAVPPHHSDADGSPRQGLTDLLAGTLPLTAVWRMLDDGGGSSVIPVGTDARRLPALVQGPAMARLLKELTRKPVAVLVAGTSLDTGTGVALARHTSAVLLVVDGQRAKVTDLTSSRDLLEQIEVHSAGAVLLHSPQRWKEQHKVVEPQLAISETSPAPAARRRPQPGARDGAIPNSTPTDESALARPRG